MTVEQLRLRVLMRDNYICTMCHRRQTKPEVDHIVPRYKGGLDSLQNLRTLCSECHKLRHHIDRVSYRMVENFLNTLLEEHGA